MLARRVDGAQLECASAARGLGAARVSLSVNARAAAAAQYKRRRNSWWRGGRRGGCWTTRWRAGASTVFLAVLRIGPARANHCGRVALAPVTCLRVLISLRKMRCERAKMAFFSLARAETGARGKLSICYAYGGEAREKTVNPRFSTRAKIVVFICILETSATSTTP